MNWKQSCFHFFVKKNHSYYVIYYNFLLTELRKYYAAIFSLHFSQVLAQTFKIWQYGFQIAQAYK